jgi:hypothetical protein
MRGQARRDLVCGDSECAIWMDILIWLVCESDFCILGYK